MVSKHATTICFLGLDSCSTSDGVLGLMEDAIVALSVRDTEQNFALNFDEEAHDEKDASHSGHEVCSMDLDV